MRHAYNGVCLIQLSLSIKKWIRNVSRRIRKLKIFPQSAERLNVRIGDNPGVGNSRPGSSVHFFNCASQLSTTVMGLFAFSCSGGEAAEGAYHPGNAPAVIDWCLEQLPRNQGLRQRS
jgi:hypothetical protein